MKFENIIDDLKAFENKPILICLILAAIGLLLPLPYGFYILLRLAFFGVLIWVVLRGPGFGKNFLISLPGLFVILALLLYNPLVLVHLGSKLVWLLLNAMTIYLMLWLSVNNKNPV